MFFKKIDMRSRKAMTEYLVNHFRYDLANSWNRSTSYANNLKVYNLGLTTEQKDKLFDIMGSEDTYLAASEIINSELRVFEEKYDYKWQAGFNGHSGGYLVLYPGGYKYDEHKSYCTRCGQRNFKSIKENGKKCGRCGEEARVDFTYERKVPYTTFSPVDMNEDFELYSMKGLKERVKLVQDFDKLCDAVVEAAKFIADNFEVVEEEVLIPQTRRSLVEKAS